MGEERTWHVTRDDSADLGFALSCLVPGAITLEEFKNWIYLVLAESEEFPDYLIELIDFEHKHELIRSWRDVVGFWPASPLSRVEERGVVGIGYARFPQFRHDTISRGEARATLQQSDALRDRFARSFPTIDIPGDEQTAGIADDDRRVSTWWLAGDDAHPLTISEVQTRFINQSAAGCRTMVLESDTGLTLRLVTNRTRVMVMLTGPGDAAGHAIDPAAVGTSGGYLLDNGQEDEYADRDTVTIPDALTLIGHVLSRGTPPQDRWSIDVPE